MKQQKRVVSSLVSAFVSVWLLVCTPSVQAQAPIASSSDELTWAEQPLSPVASDKPDYLLPVIGLVTLAILGVEHYIRSRRASGNGAQRQIDPRFCFLPTPDIRYTNAAFPFPAESIFDSRQEHPLR